MSRKRNRRKRGRKRRMSVRLKPTALVLLLFCILSITGIFAYFSDGDYADNRILIGSNEIEVTEEFDPPEELKPNSSFHKDVKITNTGESPCYIRVMVKYTDMDIGQYCTLDINSSWVEGTDGYYYYPELLDPSEQTESLFTTVEIGNIPVESITGFDIIVYGESIQCIGGTESGYQETWDQYQKNKGGTY